MKRDKDLLRMKFFAGRLSVAIVVVAFGMGWAANARGQTSAVVPSEDANAILMRMAGYLAKSQSFSVDVRDSYDAY